MAVLKALLALPLLLCLLPRTSYAQNPAFKCETSGAKCTAMVGYVTPNQTTLSALQARFSLPTLAPILGANNFPLSTSPSFKVPAQSTIKIPIPCACSGGTGASDGIPKYIVQPADGLSHIARDVFAALVTYPEIQRASKIANPNVINVGQELTIPLPCSCDEVGGEEVVHYAHLVKEGSSVEEIAKEFGTTKDVLMRLNGITVASDLKADQPLDVPLRACVSTVSRNSLDYPLRVSNGTYAITANECVKCKCDAAQKWTLRCEPSQLKPSNWSTCPSMKCAGEELFIGNTTSPGSCNSQTCAYTGYNRQAILTNLTAASCPSSNNKASGIGIRGSSWIFLYISVHVILLCLHLSL